MLFVCGGNRSAVIATLSVIGQNSEDCEGTLKEDEVGILKGYIELPFVLHMGIQFYCLNWGIVAILNSWSLCR